MTFVKVIVDNVDPHTVEVPGCGCVACKLKASTRLRAKHVRKEFDDALADLEKVARELDWL